jgi:glycosyltransferase involved in cell wall biosynthesis
MDKLLQDKSVLITTSHVDIGSGGSMQLALLVRCLIDAGAKVDVLFKKPQSGKIPNRALLSDLGVKIDEFRPNRWYSPAQLANMRARLKHGQYDIVHTHKGGDLSLVLLAGAGIEIPVLVNTRGVNFVLGANRFKYNSKKLDAVIAVSEQSKRVMVDCKVKPEKIHVIYGGVDTERFKPGGDRSRIRGEFGIAPDAMVFIVIANLLQQKGHLDYLEAAAALEKSHPGCRHLFAGSGKGEQIRRKAKELGLADRVIFAGFRTDVPELLAASDVSVFPGFAGEGVSGVLRESLACEVPVITTDVGGNAELIEHQRYGLVVPMRNPAALSSAMQRLVDDPALSSQLAQDGRKFVLKNHSAESRGRRIIDLYLQIARKKGYKW